MGYFQECTVRPPPQRSAQSSTGSVVCGNRLLSRVVTCARTDRGRARNREIEKAKEKEREGERERERERERGRESEGYVDVKIKDV